MAKSAALNPTSMPFFPGGMRSVDDDGGPTMAFASPTGNHDQDRISLSISPTDYRSLRSSPIPSFNSDAPNGSQNAGIRFQQSPPGPDWMQESPTPRSFDSDKAFLPHETRLVRESSLSSSVDTFSSAEDRFSNAKSDEGFMPRTGTPLLRQGSAMNIRNTSRSPYPAHVIVTSSSPVSSLDSGSQPASSIEHSSGFEAQLRSSPLINELMDRLARSEMTSKEIQREVSDLHVKMDFLVERILNQATQSPAQPLSQPEFKNPFAPSTPSIPLNGSRPSISLAPNQPSDDITQISQRLTTLTSSVGQLLALQTQQHMQANNAGLGGGPLSALSPSQIDIAPNQMLPPASNAIIGHGLPNRPDLRGPSRTPNPPARTWSAGSLDLPVRPPDGAGSLGRPDSLLRDKRRSVSNLMRRDSAGVDVLSGSSREGPALSKWDQLALAPELLHSLTKFGVGPPNKIQQRALPFLLRGADIIAQAPPTQERIAAYVIPAIHVALVNTTGRPAPRGPVVVMVSTTVDQATQAQRMIRDLGGPIGIRSALGVGSPSAGTDLTQELRLLQQNMPHIICGTPQKLHALFTAPGGLVGSQVRLLVLDEVDQLIARNLHEFIFNIVKLLPAPRSRPLGNLTSSSQTSLSSMDSSPSSLSAPFPSNGRRFSGLSTSPNPSEGITGPSGTIERQTALFSNTVPQDVLNLATAIQLREPVRVLVRRDGNVTHADTTQGARGLRQFYLYLALTAGGRSDSVSSSSGSGLGIIGSGRGSTNAETVQAREWKLDALSDLFEDIEVGQAIVHVGGMAALDAVVYRLASRGLDAIPMHGDMNAAAKLTALNKFRGTASGLMRPLTSKALVVYDVQIKSPEISHIPLIINYDLPKAVEEYAHRVAPAIAPTHARAGVIVNFVTATGGDVEMLRSIECFYKIKCPEVPMSLRDIV